MVFSILIAFLIQNYEIICPSINIYGNAQFAILKLLTDLF